MEPTENKPAVRRSVRLPSWSNWVWFVIAAVTGAVVVFGSLYFIGRIWEHASLIRPGGDMASDLMFAMRLDNGHLTLHGHHSRIGTYHPGPFYMWTLYAGAKIFGVFGMPSYLGSYTLYMIANFSFMALTAAALGAATRNTRIGMAVIGVMVLQAVTTYSMGGSWDALVGYVTAQNESHLAFAAAVASTIAWIKGVKWAPIAVAFSAGATVQMFLPAGAAIAPMFAATFVWSVYKLVRGDRTRHVWLTLGAFLALVAPLVARIVVEGPGMLKAYVSGYENLDVHDQAARIDEQLRTIWGTGRTGVAVATAALVLTTAVVAAVAKSNRRAALVCVGMQLWFVLVAMYMMKGYTEAYTVAWTFTVMAVFAAIPLGLLLRPAPKAVIWGCILVLAFSVINTAGLSMDTATRTGTLSLSGHMRTLPETDVMVAKILDAPRQGEAYGKVIPIDVVWNDQMHMLAVFDVVNPLLLELSRRGHAVCLLADGPQFIIPPEFTCTKVAGPVVRMVRSTEFEDPAMARYLGDDAEMLGMVSGYMAVYDPISEGRAYDHA